MRRSTSVPYSRRKVLGALALGTASQAAAQLRLPEKVRVVLIGLDCHPGDIYHPLARVPDAELVAFHDPDPKTAARLAKNPQFAKAKMYTGDFREMLDKEKPHVAGVCNANNLRAAAIVACAERKIHVAAEKPLAIEWGDYERVRKAVEASGIRLTMLVTMRYLGPYRALRQVALSGELGEIIHMSSQKSYRVSNRPAWFYRRESYGGTIPWIGSHMIDLMRWTSGRELTEAFTYQNHIGFPETGDTENVTATVFKLDNGGVASLRMDYLRPATAPSHGDDRLRLAGARGVAEYMAATGVTVMSGKRKLEVLPDAPPELALFAEFLDSVYNGKPHGVSTADCYRVTEICIRTRDGAEQGRAVKL